MRISDKMPGIILSIIYPLGGLIYSIRNMGKSGTRLCFVLFCLYFGIVFIYHQQGTFLGGGSDSERYAVWLKEAYQNRDLNLLDYVQEYRESKIDIYAPILLYSVSRFTDNPKIFFAVVALIFAGSDSCLPYMENQRSQVVDSIVHVLLWNCELYFRT